MNRILMVCVLLGFVGLLEACNSGAGGGSGSTTNDLQEQCQACIDFEFKEDETVVEEEDAFMNENQFSCLNDKCSKDEACISCLQGTQTNKTLCDQPGVIVCHTIIKEVVSNAGSPSDGDYYSDAEKTEFFNSIEHCMGKGSQEAVTDCAVKGCKKDKTCNPCFMRVKMYCSSYGDEITDCVKSQFISNCIIIPSQG